VPGAEPDGTDGDEASGPELTRPSGNAVVYQDKPKEAESSGIFNKVLMLVGGVLLVLAFWYTTRRTKTLGSSEDAPSDDPEDPEAKP
jgi:hypothetical protein